MSGPNPGKPCIFPFKYNGKTYNGCEKDHEDGTKTWCSTKVDSKGHHVPGQNEYGHCGKNCPKQGPTKPSNQELTTSELLSLYSIYIQDKSFNFVKRQAHVSIHFLNSIDSLRLFGN